MKKRMLTEMGMGTSLRRQDYTEAAVRAVRDALWHNSINLAELFGRDKAEMLIGPCGYRRIGRCISLWSDIGFGGEGGLGCAAP
jgi:hypothetical protein